ncbi:hypothetical protein ACLOJK_022484 [Asimina triloba]
MWVGSFHTKISDLKDTDGVMKQMPPLPMKVNEDLANSILPPKAPLSQSLPNNQSLKDSHIREATKQK